MNYYCCTDKRRSIVKEHETLNGIDFLEVKDNPNDPLPDRQTTLYIHFLKPLLDPLGSPPTPIDIKKENILIKGGEKVKDIKVVDVAPVVFNTPPDGSEKILEIKVNQAGDYSAYELCLVNTNTGVGMVKVLDGFDTLLSRVDFSFKVACKSDLDCKTTVVCAEEDDTPPPQINYLAKDYASFRQLMLDRMSLLVPGWQETNPADLGITLVELLAYTADYLSYRQDAITTEAYLGTSRKRISAARHARLADYYAFNGCNARAWIHIHVGDSVNGLLLEKGVGAATTKFFTKSIGMPTAITLNSAEFDKVIGGSSEFFELMHDVELYHENNLMPFYTYGEERCCLPKGAVEATLLGNFQKLKPGDFLVFSEVKGPETGHREDADPMHNHAVRLIEITYGEDINADYYLGATTSPPPSPTLSITKIKWRKEDALPFPLCISNKGETLINNVSVAYGNIVLVDHGKTMQDVNESSLSPDTVPKIRLHYVSTNAPKDQCETKSKEEVPPRFNPFLKETPLTFAASSPFQEEKENIQEIIDAGGSADQLKERIKAVLLESDAATDLMKWSNRNSFPSIYLREVDSGLGWQPKRDLLIDSAENDRHFVVEMESDGIAHIRFGNDQNGARPNSDIRFLATYRIGNGPQGNVGAKTITHIAADSSFITALQHEDLAIWNPLPARGGVEAERMEEIKQYAPQAFRTQQRAVIPADYDHFAQQCHPEVQRATSVFRWTGSWRTTFVTVDRLGGANVDEDFEKDLRNCLEQYRMAGFDLEIDAPIPVSLEIEMEICVKPNYFRGTIKSILQDVFSNAIMPNGQRGFFHPDNFSFGQPVYLSDLYAAAQSVQGVGSVKIKTFQRQGDDNSSGIDDGRLDFERQEIARLDNNPNFMDRGVISFIMKGGK